MVAILVLSCIPLDCCGTAMGQTAIPAAKDDEEKPKFAGLRPGQKIKTITFDEAMHLFVLPRTLGETPEGETVTASVGRFGPYVKYDQKFVSTKDEDPYTIDLETALRFIVDMRRHCQCHLRCRCLIRSNFFPDLYRRPAVCIAINRAGVNQATEGGETSSAASRWLATHFPGRMLAS